MEKEEESRIISSLQNLQLGLNFHFLSNIYSIVILVNHVSLADESWIVKDQFETNLYKNLHVVFFHVFSTDLLILCHVMKDTIFLPKISHF